MKRPALTRPRLVCAAGILAVAAFLGLVARFWHPAYGFTAFLQLDAGCDDIKISAFKNYPVFVYRDTGGYDGLYYAQIAYDPTLRDPELPRTMDNFSYRARRILAPALAWLLAAGRPAWIVHVYTLLNVASWLVLAALLWRLLDVRDSRGWLAWAGLLFSAGALSCVRLALPDFLALTLLTAAVWAAERRRPCSAVGWLAAAALARETALAAGVALDPGPVRTPRAAARLAGRIALAALPLAAWLLYIRYHIGLPDSGWTNFTWPVIGWLEKCQTAIVAAVTHDDRILAWTTLLATAGLTAQGAFILCRPRPDDPWWRVGAAYTFMLLCLGTPVWEGFPGAATRVLLPLNLACNVLALRTRAPLAWLAACNLTIFAGLLALRDVPHNPRELGAARHGTAACVLDLGDGWYGLESNARHRWFWADSIGRLKIEAWPRNADCEVRLAFRLHSLAPRTVRVLADGREVWRSAVGERPLAVELAPVRVRGGLVVLTFATDTAAVPEGPGPHARRLGFALYDPSVTVRESVPPRP